MIYFIVYRVLVLVVCCDSVIMMSVWPYRRALNGIIPPLAVEIFAVVIQSVESNVSVYVFLVK